MTRIAAPEDAEIAAPPDAETRRARLAEAIGKAAPGHFVPMPGGLAQVPVGRVDQGMLLYRVDNGRINAELEAHLGATGGDWQTLRAEAETPSVQRLLHGLLTRAAADERGPILRELERQRQQTEPLLVTADGVVVNGNRRLAAMRALMGRDPARFGGFAEVVVAVLPDDVAPADLDFVEAALQMAPETKLGYGWVNRRLKMRRQRDELALPEDWIVEAYQLEGPEQLAREIDELALAERYLAEWCETPGDYARIDDAETLFAGLAAQLAAPPKGQRGLWRIIGFALIAARGQLHTAPGRSFPFVDPDPRHLPGAALRRFGEEQGLLESAGEEGRDTPPDRDARARLRAVFETAEGRVAALDALLSAMAAVQEEHRERAKPGIALRRIQQLRRRLDQLAPERLDPRQQRQLRSEVAAIQAQAAYLLGESPETRFEQRKTGMVKAVSAYMRRWRAGGD